MMWQGLNYVRGQGNERYTVGTSYEVIVRSLVVGVKCQETLDSWVWQVTWLNPGKSFGYCWVLPASHVTASVASLDVHFALQGKWSESLPVVSDSLRPHGLYSPWHSPGQNPGVVSRPLLQGIFPTQGLNLGLPHCGQILYQLSHKGSPYWSG